MNLVPDQLSQRQSHPLPPAWHLDLAGSFSAAWDREFGIKPGSSDASLMNYTSVLAQLATLAIPGIDEADTADLPAIIRSALRGSCGGESFTPGTRVLLAGGSAKPISALKPGDKVLAADTKTGKNQPETVTAVEVNHDTDLYDLKVKTTSGTEVIHTTASHLFWDPYPHYGWIPAKHLKPGEKLKTPDGQSAVVVGGSVPAVHDGWMWDLTVPGNNDHDFYVAVAATAVLVHNCTEGGKIANNIADHAAERAQAGDGTHYVSGVSPQDLPGYVHQVLDGEVPGVETRYLSGGRVGYWDPAKQAVVIEEGDGGTVLTPKEGHDYFEGLR